jgi:hypothetical protein
MLLLPKQDHWAICALLNSDAYIGLLHLLMPRGVGNTGATLKYEVGYVAAVPIPELSAEANMQLTLLGQRSFDLMRLLVTTNELSRMFRLPALLRTLCETLAAQGRIYTAQGATANEQLTLWQRESNDIAFKLYDIEGEDRRAIEESLSRQSDSEGDSEAGDDEDEVEVSTDIRGLVTALVSYLVGTLRPLGPPLRHGRADRPRSARTVRPATCLPARDAPERPGPSC